MFVVSMDGPDNLFFNNESVYKNTITPDSVLRKNNHSIAYHRYSEAVDSNTTRVDNQVTDNNISDVFQIL